MINIERLAELFEFLVKIDSESRAEGKIAEEIIKLLAPMGAEILIDDSAKKTGSESGNIVAKFAGNRDVPPLFLSGHMDTVGPGKGVTPVFKDGVYTSDGTTILGADDKSAIAIIFEVIRVLQENDLPHGPIEVVLTVCEEIGLLGAKHLDFGLMDSKMGYILDSTDLDGIVTRAPYANRLEFKVHGKSAHAGAEPEKGVSAVSIAATAISRLNLGRIDSETTCNIGLIEGGTATNIVPDLVTVKGEVRSHDKEMLDKVTDDMLEAFRTAAEEFGSEAFTPELDLDVELDFPGTNIPEEHEVMTLARKGAARLDRTLESKTIGGGADANIFFGKGIMAGVLGTGMTDVHTLDESIRLEDMKRATELLLSIIHVHSQEGEAS